MPRLRTFAILSFVVSAACGASAQNSTARAAADQWMAQPMLKVHFTTRGGGTTVFETDTKAGRMNFIGSQDRVCYGSAVPVRLEYAEPFLVLHITPPVTGCEARQYRFDPVSGEGKIFRPAEGGWTELSPSGKIQLIR